MGSPGAGKTSVGRILGHLLGKEVIDVDDDVLERVWGMTVAEKVLICCCLIVIFNSNNNNLIINNLIVLFYN